MTSHLLYSLGWERIFGAQKPRGSIYLLPSEAEKVIVQYNPDFRITCLLPPKQRSIIVDWRGKTRNLSIATPSLLLSHLVYQNRYTDAAVLAQRLGVYDKLECGCEACLAELPELAALKHAVFCDCPSCSQEQVRRAKIIQIYYLFALNEARSDEFLAQPYRLANVYEDGKICFRKEDSNIRIPENLREANNTFWSNRFDNDFEWKIPHECLYKQHHFDYCIVRKRKHRCDGYSHHPHEKCRSNKEKCKCCDDTCPCQEICPCCNHACFCHLSWQVRCNCACCQNTCECPCTCNLIEPLVKMIRNYAPKDDKWEIYTKLICGKGFIGTSKKPSGVFISFNSELLKGLPDKYKIKHFKSKQLFTIGFANLMEDKSWEVFIQDFKLVLGPGQAKLIS